MVKLQGTAPNQVPTNADLGSLAYVDHDTVNNITAADLRLKALSKTKSQTAVDVFIYDTSKDSDGGAWRHRTQHTSWYNEGASSTRGSRKEFPAVAVLVLETDGTGQPVLTVHDADDPSLPVWMVFEAGGSSGLATTNNMMGTPSQTGRDFTAVTALNGTICVSLGNSSVSAYGGLHVVSFVSDSSATHGQDTPRSGNYNGNISERNDRLGLTSFSQTIVNGNCNDVAMTVLPDAPTDPATGIAVPTIAVATDGGVSVVKDDGTVVDITTTVTKPSYFVGFTDDHKLRYQIGDRNGLRIDTIPSTDFSVGGHSAQNNSEEFYSPGALVASGWAGNLNFLGSNQFGDLGDIGFSEHAIRSVKGLTFIDRNPTTPANGMVAYTTSSYNTGWMNGNIKLAALADTTAETVSGSELVTNGENWTGATGNTPPNGWTKAGSLTQYTITAGGALEINRNGEAGVNTTQIITTVAGERYQLSLDYVATSGANQTLLVEVTGAASLVFENVQDLTTYIFDFVADSSSTTIGIRPSSASNQVVEIDNVSVRLADADRSVNDKGLAVHGSITKAPVATGADVVGYSGFSSSNYLEQPYNADLDFGTGDFCVMGWVKVSSGTGRIVEAIDAGNTEGFSLFASGATVYFRTRNTNNSEVLSNTDIRSGTWRFVAGVRQNSGADHLIYIDGALDNSTIGGVVRSIGGTDSPLLVGNRSALDAPWPGDIALIRISATAPTADQIAKIYEDEKVLFQENAKATLYYDGTSSSPDAVTALAHDPVTDLLHVGTSSGRSVFQGLRRVDNTTTAVSTAISANDSLIVEQ